MRASFVVPVKDGGPRLRELLEAVARQDLAGGVELVAVDSGSRDGSPDLLERHGARVLRIAPEAFDHGDTRNLGAREARGAVAIFLSQDAVPAGADFARRLVAALEADSRLAGAFARQLPRPEADPLTRRDLQAWIAAGLQPRTVFVNGASGLDTLPPLERYRIAAFDNVASAVRRDLLLLHPFAASRFAEDVEWGQRMLRLGFGLAYVPEAQVVHSHTRTARRLFRRNYLGHRALCRLFGLCTIPDRPHLLRAAAGALLADLRTLARGGASPWLWLRAPAQALAATYGQYRGARDETLGRPYPDWARA